MSTTPQNSFAHRLWPLRPWPVLFVGLGVTLLGLLATTLGDAFAGLRFVLFLIGLVIAGAAVSMRLRRAGWAFEERMETAGVLAVAAFAALLAFLGADQAWDSMQMVLVALIAVTLLGVVLVLLPTTARMIAVSLLVVLHFGAILSAATAIDPPNAAAPWVSRVAHQYIYRPYVEFMYLNNAYHFYSPEPGPPSLLWFHVKYDNGNVKWVKIPHRDDDPAPIHHTRLLSITESTSVLYPQIPWEPAVVNDIKYKRQKWGEQFKIPVAPDYVMPYNMQEQEAQPYSQKLIESYVRHIAATNPWLGNPANGVKSIKVYRLRHTIIPPPALAGGRDPKDPAMYVAYYQGEYDEDGKLLFPDVYERNDPQRTHVDFPEPGAKLVERKDPFRFWHIPVYRDPQSQNLIDELTTHAHLDMSQDPPAMTDDPADSPWDDGTEKAQP